MQGDGLSFDTVLRAYLSLKTIAHLCVIVASTSFEAWERSDRIRVYVCCRIIVILCQFLEICSSYDEVPWAVPTFHSTVIFT